MKQFILILFSILITGCSQLDIVVRWADVTAVSRADSYFDLSGEQKDQLREDVSADITKLRKELFPQVAQSLRGLEPELKKSSPDKEKVRHGFGEVFAYFKKATAYFKDSALKTAASLSPSQLEHFAKKVRQDIDEAADENSTPDKALNMAYKRYRRSLEFWVGGINSDQKELLKNFLKKNPYPWELQNKSREHTLKLFLAAGQDKEQLQKFVADYFTDYESSRLPEFTEALNKHKAAFQDFLTHELWQSLTPTQKDLLLEKLTTRADDIQRIAQRP